MNKNDIIAGLSKLGLERPTVAPAAANYVPYMVSNKLVHIAGQLPFINGEKSHMGQLGNGFNIEQGQEAAQNCALNILAQFDHAIGGDWSKFVKVVKLGGFVNATADFNDHPQVVNGASNLIGKVLGDQGKHARFAVGAASLPFGVAVEIDAIFEIA